MILFFKYFYIFYVFKTKFEWFIKFKWLELSLIENKLIWDFFILFHIFKKTLDLDFLIFVCLKSWYYWDIENVEF